MTDRERETRLEIAKPRYLDDGEPHSDIITARRALHFCRKHIRVYHSGVLTYVTGQGTGEETRQSGSAARSICGRS